MDPKTQESKNAVPVISKLAAILAEHRKGQGNPISGWIFPNGAGTPLIRITFCNG